MDQNMSAASSVAATSDKLEGLSLSMCVADIIGGKVSLDQVSRIVASTAARNDSDWEKLCSMYAASYWRADPDAALAVVAELRARNAIIQPRLEKPSYWLSIAEGHWVPAAA